MHYQIESSLWQNVFAIPGKIVDEHLRLCGGVSLKVLLFLLRHGGSADMREISEFLGLPLADITDAINYWIHIGVLKKAIGTEAEIIAAPMEKFGETPSETRSIPRTSLVYTLTPAMLPTIAGDAENKISISNESGNTPQGEATGTPHAAKPGAVRGRLTTRQINEMSVNDQNIAHLLQEAQSVLGKPLTPVATDTIAALYSYYGMQPDLILMLLQYCLSIGKDNMRYIEKVAATWLETGIDSHEKAEREIQVSAQRSNAEYKIRRLFGIHDRALTSGEQEYIRKWNEELKCSIEIIGAAYERTVEQKGRLSFAYLDGILKNWHVKGIATKAQAREESQKGKGKKTRDSAASYDIQELEALVKYGEV